MAIQVEMWQPRIKEALFKSNTFLNHFVNRDEYVVGGKSVHIPQSGGPSGVEKNRSSLPGTIAQRTDTIITYTLNEYTSDPVLIPDADKKELSYSKMDSVISEDAGFLMEFAGDDLLYLAAANTPAGSKIATTGADALATAPGATGNRKIITEADIRSADVLLNKQNVPKEDRYLLLPPDMLNQLRSDTSLKYAFQQTVDLETGVIAKLYGFKILERSSTLSLVTSTLAVKVPTAATATSDHHAALFWQKSSIERALGDVTMFDDYGRPEYYGDIYSFLIRASARANRTDNKGYGLIYRDTAAG